MAAFYIFFVVLLIGAWNVDCHLLKFEIVHNGEVFSNKRDLDPYDSISATQFSERKAAGYLWTDKTVPYYFAADVPQSAKDQTAKAINEWETFTCLKFRPKTDTDTSYIRIQVESGGCYSNLIGMDNDNAEQRINIPGGCHTTYGIVVHEIGHAIGFNHEQKRPDRDDYLTIHWDNIEDDPSSQYQYQKAENSQTYGVPYDYMSIMHYSDVGFAKDYSKPTMTTKDPYYQDKIGQRTRLSSRDIELANAIYSCGEVWFRMRHDATGGFYDAYNGGVLWNEDGSDYQQWRLDGKWLRNRQFPYKVWEMSTSISATGMADVTMVEHQTNAKNQQWDHLQNGVQNEYEHKEFVLTGTDIQAKVIAMAKNDGSEEQAWTFLKP